MARAAWDRWIAIGFAVGSVCFFVGPFPGFVQLVGPGADGVVFFVGSIFFTLAAGLELREGTLRRGRRWGSDPSWWSAAIQFVGTLLFNLSTFDAMQDGLNTTQENHLVWAPDLFGSAAFLISGALAYRVATGPRLLPVRRTREWRHGRGEPGRLRLLHDFGTGVLCGAIERFGPRPGRRQLDHRAWRGLLLRRITDAPPAAPGR